MAGKTYSAAPSARSGGSSASSKNRRVWVMGVLAALVTALCPALLLVGADTPAVSSTRPAKHPAAATTGPATQPRTAEQRKQDDIDRVMAFFQTTQPDVYEQAKSLQSTDPQKFEQLISGTIRTVYQLEGWKKKDPQIFALMMQEVTLNYKSLRIADALKRPDLAAAEREQQTEDLARVVADDFDVQQQIRHMEIDDQAKKIQELNNTLHARDEDKDDIIRQRIHDLMEHVPGVEWGG